MTLTTGLLGLVVLAVLIALTTTPRPAARRIRVDERRDRRSSDTFEIHVTDHRGDVEDATSTAPLGRMLGLLALVAATVVGLLARTDW